MLVSRPKKYDHGIVREYRVIVYGLVAASIYAFIYYVFDLAGVEHYILHANGGDTASGIDDVAGFGDSFGYVNAWFSALAFAGVVLALGVQVMEFHLAEKDRGDTLDNQNEMKRHAFLSTLAASVKTLHDIEDTKQEAIARGNANAERLVSMFKQETALRTAVSSMLEEMPSQIELSGIASQDYDRSHNLIRFIALLQGIVTSMDLEINHPFLATGNSKALEELVDSVEERLFDFWTENIYSSSSQLVGQFRVCLEILQTTEGGEIPPEVRYKEFHKLTSKIDAWIVAAIADHAS
ncbi:hypothetical protein [Rhodopirellula baltica]|uniref:Uncharacterized protein n=1 Tax=Rhodopirellula baltica WH47 TaxID=991778 RepID=F2ALB7_RHOBT|nr:hypothetical protein [Rhodopirellula baltica]EGF29593.1 hypothetical protein RBWH47_04575 [Rhodopirellula baltica WH47]